MFAQNVVSTIGQNRIKQPITYPRVVRLPGTFIPAPARAANVQTPPNSMRKVSPLTSNLLKPIQVIGPVQSRKSTINQISKIA